MTNFIPIFPLGIVVYPAENLNLHIFEPRYKQLINECNAQKKQFGIPTVVKKRLQDYGSLVELVEVTKVYENGEMDIKTKGSRIFRILEVIKEVPDKFYSGAIVNYPDTKEEGNRELMKRVVNSIRELHKLLKIDKNFEKKFIVVSAAKIASSILFIQKSSGELRFCVNYRKLNSFTKKN